MATFNEVCIKVVFPASFISFKGVFFTEGRFAFQRILNWFNFYVFREVVPYVYQVVLQTTLSLSVLQRGLFLYSLFAGIRVQTYNILDGLRISSV